MTVYARINHIGWVHLWRSQQAFEEGEPSECFFDAKVDPRWDQGKWLTEDQIFRLKAGALVALEDPGYLSEDGSS